VDGSSTCLFRQLTWQHTSQHQWSAGLTRNGARHTVCWAHIAQPHPHYPCRPSYAGTEQSADMCNFPSRHCCASVSASLGPEWAAARCSRAGIIPQSTSPHPHAPMPCRHFHARYVDISPAVHCPHIGPTGGHKCTEDLPYSMDKIATLIPKRPTFYSVNPLLQAAINQTAKW